jgi:hypothetical protein
MPSSFIALSKNKLMLVTVKSCSEALILALVTKHVLNLEFSCIELVIQ